MEVGRGCELGRSAPGVLFVRNPVQQNPSLELFPIKVHFDSQSTLHFYLLPTCFEFDPDFPTTCFRFGRSGLVFAGKVKKTPSLFHIIGEFNRLMTEKRQTE